MTSTLRIRGLYAAALTQLFRQYDSEWTIVQPDDEIRTRLNHAWRMDSPEVNIDDEPDARGPREVLRVSGPTDAVKRVLHIVQQHCFDVITHQDSVQVGAIYIGLVGLYSRSRRRAVVYLGQSLAGVLSLRYEDREPRVGTYIPVRIDAPPVEGDDRPQLSASITVPGQYAVLTAVPGVKLSKQITDLSCQERLKRLGEAQDTGGWGIIWRTAAQHAEEPALVQEVQHLTQEARDLQAHLDATTSVGYVRGGDIVAHVYLPGHAKAACDSLRAHLLPTLPGHHKYKAQGDAYGTIVDALEKELPSEVLHTRTLTLRVLSSLDAMQPPIQHHIRLLGRDPQGKVHDHGMGEQVAFDLDAGWVEVRQALRSKEAYPSGFRIDKQPGDYTITRFQEGSWHYVTRFYGRQGEWKGDYASLTVPIAIFSDQIHLWDLPVSAWRSPAHKPGLSGLETLRRLQHQGVVTAALMQKVQAEGEALLQQFTQEGAAHG
jgi:hypothetical protein